MSKCEYDYNEFGACFKATEKTIYVCSSLNSEEVLKIVHEKHPECEWKLADSKQVLCCQENPEKCAQYETHWHYTFVRK